MLRQLAITAFALFVAVPAFPDIGHSPTGPAYPALHLMNNTEFALFLKRLDVDAVRWKVQLSHVDVRSLGLDRQEGEEVEKSYSQCLQSLDNTREEIQKLSQKQTLKLDFLLLVDVNDLARSLDGLNRDLANMTPGDNTSAQKSLGYAREVLGIDAALAAPTAEFQHHVLAFATVIDATLDQVGQDPVQPEAQN
jgi:hypothetical protein